MSRSDLFAGQDWTVLYRAFSSINFNASDPGSINRALREYIRSTYPEDFNDYIASSEFIAIIDLLAWLAGTLAYKTDIAARENFLETAEARESILRLARFLSYNASRSRPSRSVLKIVEIETSEEVQDSLGNSLASVPITWDDPDEPDWFERFITVLNAAMPQITPYGTPLKQGNIGGNKASLYRLNGAAVDSNLSFNSVVAGERMIFEAVNGDFDENGLLFQRTPDPFAAMHIYSLSDGSGNSSPRTGLFAFFKQGGTQQQTIQIDVPIENQIINVDFDNVTMDDIWVQTIDDSGDVLVNWNRVPAVFSENITFNSMPLEQRNIYSVITRDDDRISIRFSDGRFGNAPVGLIRITCRTGNGLNYIIRSGEIDRVRLTVPYTDRDGITRTLALTCSLQETVNNATSRETDEEIRARAPLVYATQGRMVSGEDYNTFPLLANLATRIKALNRVYSGQSRYVERHDPTGTYSDVSVFGDDGILFREPYGVYGEVPSLLNRTPSQMVELHILPILRSPEVALRTRTRLYENVPVSIRTPQGRTWQSTDTSSSSSSGYFTGGNSNVLRTGASLRFRPVGSPVDGSLDIWTSIVGITAITAVSIPPLVGEPGAVTLSENVPSGSILVDLIPRYTPEIQSSLVGGEFGLLSRIDANNGFGLWYDYTQETGAMWFLGTTDPQQAPSPASVLVLTLTYISYTDTGIWQLFADGLRYVFESERRCEFYLSGRRSVDSRTGEQRNDLIQVLKVNEDLRSSLGRSLDRDWSLTLSKLYLYADGTPEPRRTIVQLADIDEDGVSDRPDTFEQLIAPPNSLKNRLLFWQVESDRSEIPMPQVPDPVALLNGTARNVVISENLSLLSVITNRKNYVAYVPTNAGDGTFGTFYTWSGATDDSGDWVSSSDYVVRLGRGPNVANQFIGQQPPVGYPIAYNWRHYAPMNARIDPAATNIQDIFVLGNSYNDSMRSWVARGAIVADRPSPPSELDLRLAFSGIEQFRMFSDQIIWRPVQYKLLFGPGSDPELRAQFKVVRLSGNSLTDGEIRSRVIRAIDEYFSASRWDFGETFYFTELAAYLHQQLAGIIGSVVVVPSASGSVFGDGFEIMARADEMFLSTAQISDVVLIGSNTPTAIRSSNRLR